MGRRPIVCPAPVLDDRRREPPVMRRLLLGLLLVALRCPRTAAAAVRVSAFYYPWYGTAADDGAYQHWAQDGHTPPNDIASSYYPARGALLVDATRSCSRRRWTRSAAPGSTRSPSRGGGRARPRISGCRRSSPPRTPTGSRSPRTSSRTPAARSRRTVADVALPARRSGSRRSTSTARSTCRSPTGRRRRPRCTRAACTLFAQTALVGAAAAARLRRRLHLRHRHVRRRQVRADLRRGARDAPALRAVGRARLRRAPRRRRPAREAAPQRRDLRRDVARPRSSAAPTVVTITSYNEWHEGTQIEPAAPPGRHGALPLPLVRRRVGPARRRRRARVPRRARATGSDVFRKHARRCSRRRRPRRAPLVGDAAQLRVRRGRRARPATRRARAPPRPRPSRSASSASTEMTPRVPVCRRADALELAQLLERVDADVRVGADAEPDPAVRRRARPAGSRRRGSPRSSGRRRCARRRRASRSSSCAVGVRRVHDRRARAEAALAVEQLDRPQRRARRGTRRSRAAARRRGRAAAARARRRSGRARRARRPGRRGRSGGRRRRGCRPPRSASSSPRYSATDSWRKRGQPPRR